MRGMKSGELGPEKIKDMDMSILKSKELYRDFKPSKL